jgi:hypothetical protein
VSESELYAATTPAAAALPWRWRIVAAAGLLVALALLAIVLAFWGWRWFGPAPVTISPNVADGDGDSTRRIAEAHLFGTAAPTVTASESAPGGGDLRLLGVFAQRDGQGYALFRAGARGPLLVAAGGEAAPGVRLESVRPGGVTLVERGARREVPLRRSAAPEATRASVTAAGPKSAACGAPGGFAGQVIRLNAELLSGMIGAPDTWKALVQPGPGGLIVRDQSGFAGMMGLRNGDHVERANGIALAIPDDIAATVLKPLTRSQPVWVSGARDGKPQQWLYLNAGACPA